MSYSRKIRRSPAGGSSAGSGLGLAISRAIVEAHGGRIWVADEVACDGEAGARVRFSLSAAIPA